MFTVYSFTVYSFAVTATAYCLLPTAPPYFGRATDWLVWENNKIEEEGGNNKLEIKI